MSSDLATDEVQAKKDELKELIVKVQDLERAYTTFINKIGGETSVKNKLSKISDFISKSDSNIKKVEDSLKKAQQEESNFKALSASYTDSYTSSIEETKTKLNDLENEEKQKINKFVESGQEEFDKFLSDCKNNIDLYKQNFDDIKDKANTALASATSVGLAKKFEDRSLELRNSMYLWLFILVLALGATVSIVSSRIEILEEVLKQARTIGALALYATYIFSAIAIGAPLWLSWLAVKQVGNTFRLSEDYAFKASVAASYEGFRREVDNIAELDNNTELRRKLIESILSRYDESPLRYIDNKNSGHPFFELLKDLGELKNLKKSQ